MLVRFIRVQIRTRCSRKGVDTNPYLAASLTAPPSLNTYKCYSAKITFFIHHNYNLTTDKFGKMKSVKLIFLINLMNEVETKRGNKWHKRKSKQGHFLIQRGLWSPLKDRESSRIPNRYGFAIELKS